MAPFWQQGCEYSTIGHMSCSNVRTTSHSTSTVAKTPLDIGSLVIKSNPQIHMHLAREPPPENVLCRGPDL